jgi:hypothetical protein
MPFYICQALFSQCITANAGNAQGQDVCTNNIKPLCATIDPPKSPISDSGSGDGSSTTSGASKPTQTTGGSNQVSTTSSKAFAGPTLAPVGNGAFIAAMGLMAYML